MQINPKLNHSLKRIIFQVLISLLGFTTINVHANVIQYFAGLSYSNPAELYIVHENEAIIGGTTFTFSERFNGYALNRNTERLEGGVNSTKTISLLPYGRIAVRYNDRLVFGVDVTQPFHTNHDWGNEAFTRYAVTQKYINDVEVSPRFSYSVNEKLKAGAGLNFNFLSNYQTDWTIPTGATTYSNLVNTTAGYGTGFNAGLFYLFNPSNSFGIAYYSRIYQKTHGTSRWEDHINNSLAFNFTLPATTILSYIHSFSPKWRTNLQLFYSQWSSIQQLHFLNTALPPPLNPNVTSNLQFKNTFAIRASLRHQFTNKLGLSLLGFIDQGAQSAANRSISLAADNTYLIGASAEYDLTDHVIVKVLYGYAFMATPINDVIKLRGENVPSATGRLNIHANVLDLRLKIRA